MLRVFSKCDVARKLRCGRTKVEMIAINVLKPFALESVLEEINDSANPI